MAIHASGWIATANLINGQRRRRLSGFKNVLIKLLSAVMSSTTSSVDGGYFGVF
jgi:hypothetical protein